MLYNNLLIKKYHIIFNVLIIKKLEMKQTHSMFKINNCHKLIKIKLKYYIHKNQWINF